jgi:hypothetical protein
MKRSLVVILAIFLFYPLGTRSQNEGIKPVSNPAPAEKEPMHSRATREMAFINQQAPGGVSPCPAGLPSGNTSCYFDSKWASGRVMLSDNSIIEDVQLRYDLYHQQLQFIKDGDTLAFAKPDEVKCFMLGTHHFIYSGYILEDKQGKGFFEVVADGSCQLLLRRTIQYHGTPESNPDLQEEVYLRDCSYYISKNGNVASQVRLNKKSVLSAFSDKEEQVRQFMEENKIKMNACDKLVKVVDYYNSLF